MLQRDRQNIAAILLLVSAGASTGTEPVSGCAVLASNGSACGQ
jgi:hypothetical protein